MAWLIGIQHDDKHLEDVLKRLSKEELAGKKVMLEMFSYPMTDDLRKMNSHFVKQWEGIAGYVQAHNGQIIFGENKELYYGALKSMKDIAHEMAAERKPGDLIWESIKRIEQNWTDYFHEWKYKKNDLYEQKKNEEKRIAGKIKDLKKQYDEAPLKERQPHFAKIICEEKPDIIILAASHMPYLVNNCFSDNDYSLTCIPSDGFSCFHRNL
jgi:predicted DNA-binding protein YlxM (UPF0122 family)